MLLVTVFLVREHLITVYYNRDVSQFEIPQYSDLRLAALWERALILRNIRWPNGLQEQFYDSLFMYYSCSGLCGSVLLTDWCQ